MFRIVITSSCLAELLYWLAVNVHIRVVTKICVTPALFSHLVCFSLPGQLFQPSCILIYSIYIKGGPTLYVLIYRRKDGNVRRRYMK